MSAKRPRKRINSGLSGAGRYGKNVTSWDFLKHILSPYKTFHTYTTHKKRMNALSLSYGLLYVSDTGKC